jgi:YidC/Oxa1 family membrane protein insertase
MRSTLILITAGFVVLCGGLIIETGLFQKGGPAGQKPCTLLAQTASSEQPSTADTQPRGDTQLQTPDVPTLSADHAEPKTITLGSTDPNSGFKFQLELTTKGAAIAKATFSEFDDRDYKNPKPLVILSPVNLPDGRQILSMANGPLVFSQQQSQLPLDKLHWQLLDTGTAEDGSQAARFEAVVKVQGTNKPVIKLIKTYRLTTGSYMLDCDLVVENFSDSEQKLYFHLDGPCGLGREDVSRDMRKAVAGFRDPKGQITSARLGLNAKKLYNSGGIDTVELTRPGATFLWLAAVNKYFAAILVPVPQQGKDYCDWVTEKRGTFYNPDVDKHADSGDETVGVSLKTATVKLAPAGETDSTKQYKFQLYLGPKDKSIFDKNELYRKLGFFQTIDFMPCFCCPANIINPLAFGILAIMKWMYGFIHNYGVVIIILVFLMRLVMHPITKKSQVSMSRMTKLAPMAEEIKKKYANNKTEMNKQLMTLYKEQGASPVMGMLPMLVQMPIWIALWSAVYTSIDLRGAAFLPFWITDLSAPDVLVRFSVVTIPLLEWKINSLNLLPILMGVAFYLQQKLTPQQAAANPQAAQQQKMMMIMMPLLFPLMLYKAPSGVNLYIMASTFAGVIEQYVIKKHIREKEDAEEKGLVATTSKTGGKVKKKKPKPFFKNF